MNRAIDVATSFATSLVRLGAGMSVGSTGARPERLLEIWEFEGCPYCKKVREALSILDLDARIHPCPKGGPRFRPELVERGGKAQFPYLLDPNTGAEMYESDDIVRYLFLTYGAGSVPWLLGAGPLTDLSAGLSSALRPGRGTFYTRAKPAEQTLELYSFEASPFSRIVREELSRLELPYVLHNVARGSVRRDAFVARSGRMIVPYLIDPNTDTELFESADIVRYLRATYATGES